MDGSAGSYNQKTNAPCKKDKKKCKKNSRPQFDLPEFFETGVPGLKWHFPYIGSDGEENPDLR